MPSENTIGLVLFDDAEELDFVGPWEVFTASAALLELGSVESSSSKGSTESGGTDLVVTIAAEDRAIRCAKGLRVLPDHTFESHPRLDVVLVPGGVGTRREVGNPVLIDWLAAVGEECDWVTSVCTGSLLLHQAGPGRGKRLATHWSFEDTLEARGDCTVVRDSRWVRDGSVVSSQGVSAGIDMALWLVGQLHGAAHARATQRYIQYDPAPPYQAEI